jgi:hypothetical protein
MGGHTAEQSPGNPTFIRNVKVLLEQISGTLYLFQYHKEIILKFHQFHLGKPAREEHASLMPGPMNNVNQMLNPTSGSQVSPFGYRSTWHSKLGIGLLVRLHAACNYKDKVSVLGILHINQAVGSPSQFNQ